MATLILSLLTFRSVFIRF